MSAHVDLVGNVVMEEVRAHVRASIERDNPGAEEVVDYVSDAHILATLDDVYPGGVDAYMSDHGVGS